MIASEQVFNDRYMSLLFTLCLYKIKGFCVSLKEKDDQMTAYRRILLKLSGEALMADRSHGIDPERLNDYIEEIIEVSRMGTQVGIVIGGGNIFRGMSGVEAGFDRVKGDYMGMLATVINGLALNSAFQS